MSETTRNVVFRVASETYQVWYKNIGDLKSGVRPLVVLHGGPGIGRHYFLPFKGIHTRFSIPIVFYDQIGNDASSCKGHAKEFWTVELFIDRFDNVLEHLGISGDFDLAGHSSGGMLAAHYVSYGHPPGLQCLVLASAEPSMTLWIENVRHLLQQHPEDLREKIEKT